MRLHLAALGVFLSGAPVGSKTACAPTRPFPSPSPRPAAALHVPLALLVLLFGLVLVPREAAAQQACDTDDDCRYEESEVWDCCGEEGQAESRPGVITFSMCTCTNAGQGKCIDRICEPPSTIKPGSCEPCGTPDCGSWSACLFDNPCATQGYRERTCKGWQCNYDAVEAMCRENNDGFLERYDDPDCKREVQCGDPDPACVLAPIPPADGFERSGDPYACCADTRACTCQDIVDVTYKPTLCGCCTGDPQDLRVECDGGETCFDRIVLSREITRSDCEICEDGTCLPENGQCVAHDCTASCEAQSGWYPDGDPYDCCDGDALCTCQNMYRRRYFCQESDCLFVAEAGTTVSSDCTDCGHTCEPWGACEYPDTCATRGQRMRECVAGTCAGNMCSEGATYPEYEECSRPTPCPVDEPCVVSCAPGELCWGGTCFGECTTHPDCPDLCWGYETEPDYNRCVDGDDACAGVTCPAGQVCWGGSCFDTCIDDGDCSPPNLCFNDRCTDDPCAFVQCPIDQVCWGGSCFETCVDNGDCSPPNLCFNDRCTDDPCAGVQCSSGQTCWGGTCFDTCTDSGDCTPPNTCFDGRCAEDPCTGVQCPAGSACWGGTCFDTCTDNGDCTPPNVCHNGFCNDDPCFMVDCPAGTACWGGTCFDTCTDRGDCTPPNVCHNGFCAGDPCDVVSCPAGSACWGGTCFDTCTDSGDCTPPNVCHNGFCAGDPCDVVSCPAGSACWDGTCFETCTDNGDCTPPNTCFDGRCLHDACDVVECGDNEVCYEGTCFAACSQEDECDPDHHCFRGMCVANECDGVNAPVCHGDQVCHRGVCYDPCTSDDECAPPFACFAGVCAADSCHAQLDDYDTNHVYRTVGAGFAPFTFQRSRPMMRPRPVVIPGTSSSTESAVQAFLAANPDALARGRVRLFLVLLEGHAPPRYALVMANGRNGGSQQASGVTYSVRYASTTPSPAVHILRGEGTAIHREGDFRHHQIQLESRPGEAGAVVLATFPARENFDLFLHTAMRGDLGVLEFYSAPEYPWQEPTIIALEANEELTLRNRVLDIEGQLALETGTAACTPGRAQGICSRGTYQGCRMGEMECHSTVTAMAYELCDGQDNTCNGLVDAEDPSLRFPMVYVRHSKRSEWARALSVDHDDTAHSYLRYTPHGSNVREGSAAATRLEDSGRSLLDHERALLFFHRDVRQNTLTMPLIFGRRESKVGFAALPESARVTATFNYANRLASDGSHGTYDMSDQFFVSWYDDWLGESDSRRDEVWRRVGHTEQQMRWGVRRTLAGSGGAFWREADSALAQFDLSRIVGSYRPMTFSLSLDLPRSLSRLRLYTPYRELLSMRSGNPVEVRVQYVRPEDTLCASPTPFIDDSGVECRMAQYTCETVVIDRERTIGVTHCPTPTVDSCTGCQDRDGDGYMGYDAELCPEGTDCDDDNPEVNPGATERCDGRDTNCDGLIDAIGPDAEEDCPDDRDTCGPAMCQYRSACVCPEGPDACYCSEAIMEGVEPEKPLQFTSHFRATSNAPAGEPTAPQATAPQSPAPKATACTSAPAPATPRSPVTWLLLAGATAWFARRRRSS